MALVVVMQTTELGSTSAIIDSVSLANVAESSLRFLPDSIQTANIGLLQAGRRRRGAHRQRSPKKNLLNVSQKKLHCRWFQQHHCIAYVCGETTSVIFVVMSCHVWDIICVVTSY